MIYKTNNKKWECCEQKLTHPYEELLIGFLHNSKIDLEEMLKTVERNNKYE